MNEMNEMPIRPTLNLYGLLKQCDLYIYHALDDLADPDYANEDAVIKSALHTLAKASDCSQRLRDILIEYETELTRIMQEVRDIADEIDSI